LNSIHSVFLFLFLNIVLGSCSLLEPDELVPSYIQIDSFALVDNPNADEGSLTNQIVDAWVFIDDEMIGIFELPAKVPVLTSGNHKLTVGPGILVSTNSTIRENYPFYNAHVDQNFSLIAGESVDLIPQTSYRDEGSTYEYIVVDDFETAFTQIDSFSGSAAAILKTEADGYVYDGTGSGLVTISKNDSLVALRTPAYQFPASSKPVYMEMDYFSDYSVTIGVFVKNIGIQNEVIDYLTIKPTTDEDGEEAWKKAYVELTSITSAAANPESFYVFFNVRIESPALRKDGHFALDNIKFMYQR